MVVYWLYLQTLLTIHFNLEDVYADLFRFQLIVYQETNFRNILVVF